MALTVEIGSRLNLQFRRVKIAIYLAITFKLKKFLHFNGAIYFAHDIRGQTTDIAFYDTVCTDDYLGCTMDVANERTINAQIAAAGNIAFESGSTAYNGGTA